jgi:hypothetical protein
MHVLPAKELRGVDACYVAKPSIEGFLQDVKDARLVAIGKRPRTDGGTWGSRNGHPTTVWSRLNAV